VFTTFNPFVDHPDENLCPVPNTNCRIFGGKDFVWLNGSPQGSTGMPDGCPIHSRYRSYGFFTVRR
jgi:hypothetical protein